MTRTVKPSVPTELQEQIKLAVWLSKKGIRFTAIPNGGSRHYLEAINLKRSGVSAGFPDIFVPWPSGAFHGLFIEMKRTKGGKVSEEQQNWIDYLNSQGYYAVVSYGFDHAKQIVEEYLNLHPKAA